MTQGRESFAVLLVRIALTAAAYALMARLSLQAAVLEDGSSLLWLPAGVAVGLTYWWGYRVGVPGRGGGNRHNCVWLYWGRWELALLSGLDRAAARARLPWAWLLRRAWQVRPAPSATGEALRYLLLSASVASATFRCAINAYFELERLWRAGYGRVDCRRQSTAGWATGLATC
jgi:hypothetical protein